MQAYMKAAYMHTYQHTALKCLGTCLLLIVPFAHWLVACN